MEMHTVYLLVRPVCLERGRGRPNVTVGATPVGVNAYNFYIVIVLLERKFSISVDIRISIFRLAVASGSSPHVTFVSYY